MWIGTRLHRHICHFLDNKIVSFILSLVKLFSVCFYKNQSDNVKHLKLRPNKKKLQRGLKILPTPKEIFRKKKKSKLSESALFTHFFPNLKEKSKCQDFHKYCRSDY